jgi:hypothetical protein
LLANESPRACGGGIEPGPIKSEFMIAGRLKLVAQLPIAFLTSKVENFEHHLFESITLISDVRMPSAKSSACL